MLKNINEDKPSSYRKTISILSHCSIHPFCLPYPSSYLAIKSATVNKRGVRGQRSELRGGVTGNRVFQLTTSDSFQFLSLSLSLCLSLSFQICPCESGGRPVTFLMTTAPIGATRDKSRVMRAEVNHGPLWGNPRVLSAGTRVMYYVIGGWREIERERYFLLPSVLSFLPISGYLYASFRIHLRDGIIERLRGDPGNI